jgi:hypothetical protein
MVLTKMDVHVVLAYLNVLIVKLMLLPVPYVMQTELIVHQLVHVMMDIMKMEILV